MARPHFCPIDRRSLLRTGALAGPLFMAAPLRAAIGPSSPRLLVVFLRGAYDAANVVAPTGSAFYHEARPTIGLGHPDPARPDAPMALDGDWSLHPALAPSLGPLWRARQVAFVPFAGTDDMSRSHFETQDTIELGQSLGGTRDFASGFLGRLAGSLSGEHAKAMAFTRDLPLIFRGGPAVPNIRLDGGAGQPLDPRQAALVSAMYKDRTIAGVALGPAIGAGLAVRDEVAQAMKAEMEGAGRDAITARGFELEARRMALLMRQDVDLAFVDVGGWDTHVNQGGVTGNLAARIGELGRGLAAFAEALGPEVWRSTVVVVLSEFGRTFRENGDRGTDHGHGSVYWVLGGSVAGGRIAGPQVALRPETLNQGRDLPVLTDYRALLGGLMRRQFALSADRLAKVFPGVAPVDLGLI